MWQLLFCVTVYMTYQCYKTKCKSWKYYGAKYTAERNLHCTVWNASTQCCWIFQHQETFHRTSKSKIMSKYRTSQQIRDRDLDQNFMFLSDYVETLYDWWLYQVDMNICTTIFYFHTCSREIVDISLYEKKTFNIGFFSPSVKTRSLCDWCVFKGDIQHVFHWSHIILIELYLFIPLSVTLTLFQGHSNVKQF